MILDDYQHNERSIMQENINSAINGLDEAVREVEEYMASKPNDPIAERDPVETITIKFAKGLIGEPFMSKNEKELVEIRIPNSDPDDKRPWQTFVLAARDVHENQFGKGLWAKIPADGHTTVQRSVAVGEVNGKTQWEKERKTVTNTELKSMVEYYKERPRDSVIDRLHEASDHSHEKNDTSVRHHEDQPFL